MAASMLLRPLNLLEYKNLCLFLLHGGVLETELPGCHLNKLSKALLKESA